MGVALGDPIQIEICALAACTIAGDDDICSAGEIMVSGGGSETEIVKRVKNSVHDV
jgi:hypothetical protein